jgi:molybdopterin-synthase adenylyltransferase
MSIEQRYNRQILHWGESKQQQIEQATVLVAGLGGLGGTLSQLLARAGVGKLYLLDDGRVDWPDLNRQAIYTEQDIGQLKVDCACRLLHQINSQITIAPIVQRIDSTFNCPTDITLAADCLDNFSSRFQLEDALSDGIHLVHGAIEKEQGQILTLRKGDSQSLQELFAGIEQPQGDIPVTGAAATAISALMTNEIYQVIFGTPELLNRFLIIGLSDLHFSFLDV